MNELFELFIFSFFFSRKVTLIQACYLYSNTHTGYCGHWYWYFESCSVIKGFKFSIMESWYNPSFVCICHYCWKICLANCTVTDIFIQLSIFRALDFRVQLSNGEIIGYPRKHHWILIWSVLWYSVTQGALMKNYLLDFMFKLVAFLKINTIGVQPRGLPEEHGGSMLLVQIDFSPLHFHVVFYLSYLEILFLTSDIWRWGMLRKKAFPTMIMWVFATFVVWSIMLIKNSSMRNANDWLIWSLSSALWFLFFQNVSMGQISNISFSHTLRNIRA